MKFTVNILSKSCSQVILCSLLSVEHTSFLPVCCLSPFSLVNEVNEIAGSVDALMQKLNDAENALKDLQDNRMTLEKEVQIKKNSLFIDKEKCITHRPRYPSTKALQGYVN